MLRIQYIYSNLFEEKKTSGNRECRWVICDGDGPLAKCREKILYKLGQEKEKFPSNSAPAIYGYFPPEVCSLCTQYSFAHILSD
jgi:hypothetical protein